MSLVRHIILYRSRKKNHTTTCNTVMAHPVKYSMSGNISPSIPVTQSFFQPIQRIGKSAFTDVLQKN